MDKNLADLVESVAFIRDNMVTRDDVREIVREEMVDVIRTETADMRADIAAMKVDVVGMKTDIAEIKVDNRNLWSEVRAIHERLDEIAAELKSWQKDSTKEIDHILQRVVTIEKHLGLAPQHA